ncbi:hypothetical protein PCASD_19743 [Puccinia coronata f. sp. avenae]|uniref:HAT C-terminal dimerisation domain-containing protein n=1 Tax=Puccinia coronata f. sp. avenae TaxID=200324 RepID=A0A2N5T4A4_9BASI|nr:hypothetical protein PCASD_19743 [Puccinia coronata f. sp. avenae]
MAKGVSTIFQTVDSTNWDYKQNHHRCVCHIIALILGAGLKALKISKTMDLVEEEIVLNDDQSSTAEEIDPNNAEAGSHEPGWEKNRDDSDFDSDVDAGECEATGIAFTLKKAAQPDSPTEIQIQLESNEDGNSPKSDPELNAYNFFPIVPEAKQINTELQRYNNGAFPMDKKGCVLGWWKQRFSNLGVIGL